MPAFGGSSGGAFGGGGGGGGGGYFSRPKKAGGSTGPTDNDEMLNSIARMMGSGDERLANMARTSLKNNRHRFSEDELEKYGLKEAADKKGDHRSLFSKAVGGGLSALATAGEIISRPQQTVAHGLKAIGEPLGEVAYGLSHGEGLWDTLEVAGQTARDDLKATAKATHDLSGESDINTREMLGVKKGAGGSGWFGDYVVGGADLAGQMVTDPLAYTGVGVGAKGASQGTKAGLEAFERVAPGTRAAIKAGGKEAVDEATIRAARAEAIKMAAEGKAPGRIARALQRGPITKLKANAIAESAGRKGALKGLEGAERIGETNIDLALSRGRAGLKFGGETLVGKGTLRAPFVKAGLFGEDATRAVEQAAKVGNEAAEVSEPVARGDGSFEKIAKLDGKPVGSVNYHVDPEGVVQIDGIVTLPGGERKGIATRLIEEVEQHTGQSRAAFGPGEGVEPGAEGFWQSLQGPGTVDVTERLPPTNRVAAGVARGKAAMQDAFVTGARTSRVRGAETAEKMKGAFEHAAGSKHAATADAQNTLLNAMGDAMKESKSFADEARDVIYPAMEKAGPAIEHADAAPLRASIEEATTKLADLRTQAIDVQRAAERARMAGRTAEAFGAQQRGAELAARIQDAEAALADSTAQLDSLPVETMTGAEDLARRMDAAKRPAAARAIRTLDQMRTEYTKTLEEAGLLPEEIQHAQQEYMRRITTKDANKVLKDIAEGRRAAQGGLEPSELGREMNAGGSFEARQFQPNMPVKEANEAARSAFSLPEGKDFYRSDPFLSVGRRAGEAEQALAEQRYLEEVMTITDNTGRPVMSTTKTAEHPVEIATRAGTYYAPADIADEVSRFQSIVLNDQALARWEKGMDKVQRIWKSYATVPLIGAAFHMRNGQTNMMLNWIAGMGLSDLGYYAKAGRLQGKISEAESLIGKPVEGAAGRTTHTMETALRSAGLDDDTVKAVLEARNHNVLGASYYRNDLGTSGAGKLAMPSIGQRVASGLNPANLDNYAIRSGRFVGGSIEDNARLAHFLWARDRLGNSEQAANSVKKYLFNYEDLTPFEKKVMKRTIPFYTFMRKNTGLMVNTLAENPGKLSRLAMVEKETRDENNPLLENVSLPGYAAREGQTQRSFIPGNIVGSMETPMSAAVDTLKPFVHAAAMAPGIEKIAPDELKDERGIQGLASDLVELPGGPTAEFAKSVVKYATGKDTFTGADVNPWKDSVKDRALEVADWFAPAPGKVNSVTEAMLGGKNRNKAGNDNDAQRRAAIIKMVLGLNTTAYDDKTTTSTNIGRFMDLDTALRQYNSGKPPLPEDATLEEVVKAGRVPTLAQLREAGLIPPAPKHRAGNGTYGF